MVPMSAKCSSELSLSPAIAPGDRPRPAIDRTRQSTARIVAYDEAPSVTVTMLRS
jgi:hypothetical protein